MMKRGRYIIGIGNPDCGDDGVGRLVARELCDRVEAGIDVLETNGDVDILFAWLEQAEAAYLVDAAYSGCEPPGTIHRFDAHDGPLPQTLSSLSSHGFGPGEAVELARVMGTLPTTCVVYAVEGAHFETGQPVSTKVVTAAEIVVRRLLAELSAP